MKKEGILMKNYIVLHGSFGSKDGNWFPWIKEQLENRNKEVVVPQMPVGEMDRQSGPERAGSLSGTVPCAGLLLSPVARRGVPYLLRHGPAAEHHADPRRRLVEQLVRMGVRRQRGQRQSGIFVQNRQDLVQDQQRHDARRAARRIALH